MTDDTGCKVEVVSPGDYNRDAGPDFLNTRVRIGGTLWVGNSEIHVNSSDWYRHGHHVNPAYNNVVLHVVAVNDGSTYTAAGLKVPCLVLTIPGDILNKYHEYVNNPLLVACQTDLCRIDRYLLINWLGSLCIERLQARAGHIEKLLADTMDDWEEAFYRLIARYYGARVNTDNFEMLARILPLKILRKHVDNRLQVEALLFGTAGMLDGELFREAVNDTFFRELMHEFRVLRSKYSLVPMHGWLWKFHRLRPAGFPTVRLSQLAGLICRQKPLFSEVLEASAAEEIHNLFRNPASEYWGRHYVFGKKTTRRQGYTGEDTLNMLIINAVAPMLYTYGKKRDKPELANRAIILLEKLKPEINRITAEWKNAGIEAGTAFDTQALTQLLNEYCRRKRCLECRIGQKLISMGMAPVEERYTLMDQDPEM